MEAAGLGWNWRYWVCVHVWVCRVLHSTISNNCTLSTLPPRSDDLHIRLVTVLRATAWLTRISHCTFIAAEGLSELHRGADTLVLSPNSFPQPSITLPQQVTCGNQSEACSSQLELSVTSVSTWNCRCWCSDAGKHHVRAWFTHGRMSLRWLIKTTQNIIGTHLPRISGISEVRCLYRAHNIWIENTYPIHSLFTLLSTAVSESLTHPWHSTITVELKAQGTQEFGEI